MANFTNLNQAYHIFSKSPVADEQTLQNVRNKSGHTVTTSEIWADEIPAFFIAYTEEQKTQFENIAEINDLCQYKENLYKYNGNSWVKRGTLTNKEILYNRDNKPVIMYHTNKKGYFINGNNNNQASGNYYTVRVKKDDGSYINQFVSSVDKIVEGNPSSGYNPVVIDSDGNKLQEDLDIKETNNNSLYIANSYAGIIQFHQTQSAISDENNEEYVSNIEISVFEYIGKKLSKVLEDTSGFKYKVIDNISSLPKAEEIYEGWSYFAPSEKQEAGETNIYNEYICLNIGDKTNPIWEWEQLGSVEINLPDTGMYIIEIVDNDGKKTWDVNVSSTINNTSNTIPTTQSVYKHITNTDSEHVHLTEEQKLKLYEPVESYETDIDNIFNPESQNNYVGCVAFVTNEITKSTTVDLKVNSFKLAGMFKPADDDNNHIVVSKKLCIWECNDNNRVNTATVSNPIVLSQIVNADPESNDSDGYQVTYRLAKYATFKAGKVYFITFHSEDYEPPTSAASHQKCQFVADYVNRYNESGSNGIYYVNYSSDKLFSYDNINYNYTLRVVLNSNKEIEHVVTDKNLESYIEELLYNYNSDISKIAYLKNDSIDYVNQIGEGEPPSGGRADAKSIHLSKSHFLGDTLGRITKIEIPRPNSAGSSTSRDAAYLAVQLFKNDEAISNIIYSDNTQSYSDGGSYIFNFDWNKLILIDYDIIKLSFVRSKDEIINQNTFIPSGGYTFRVIVWTSDDDACVVYDGGGVRQNNWGIKIKASIEDTNNSTKQVHTLDMHITPELRNYISYLESRISNLEHLLATNS